MTKHRFLLQTVSALHAADPTKNQRFRRNAQGQPVLRAASLKGALRKQYRDAMQARFADQADWKTAANQSPDLQALFGSPDRSEAGQLDCSPLEILALPVRSLQGTYVYLSSVSIFQALADELTLEDSQFLKTKFDALSGFQVHVATDNPCILPDSRLVLESFAFEQAGDLSPYLPILQKMVPAALLPELSQRLVIVSEKLWQHFMQAGLTQVAYTGQERIQHLEALPPQTLLHASMKIGGELTYSLPATLRLGSHLSSGLGLCQLFTNPSLSEAIPA